MVKQLEIATLAAGCFWCVEAVFTRLKGVESVVSGYSGGDIAKPSYNDVCSGETGHAEAVQISFDPDIISFDDLLDVFWRVHDPTTLNRQGADIGSQYRSAIFYHDSKQREVAEQSLAAAEAAKLWPDPIVTEIVPFDTFYPAEDYHQDYYRLNPHQPYCRLVIDPKISKLQKNFNNRLKGSSLD
jgi:peptide-methionine (S)-S-oxide reductase